MKTAVAKTIAILIGSAAAAMAQPSSPYTSVVPLGNGPTFPNTTNLNVNYWSTGAGWADTTGFNPGISIVTAPGGAAPLGQQWSTTDPFTGSAGDVGVLQSNAFTDSNGSSQDPATGGQTFNFGGQYAGAPNFYLPGVTSPSYYKSFAPSSATNVGSVWTFAEFAIVGPSANYDATYTNQDSFGFSLWNGAPNAGTALAEFKFGRQYTVGDALLDPDKIGFAWFLNGVQQTTNDPGLTGEWAIFYNQVYRLNVSVDTNNLMNVSLDTLAAGTFDLVANTPVVTNAAVGGGNSWSDYNTVSIDWDLISGDTNSPGANYINVNTVEVVTTTVPEPSTYALLLVSGAAALWAARRRRN